MAKKKAQPPKKAAAPVTKGFTDVIARALVDDEFRKLLQTNLEKALEGHTLSPSDQEAITSSLPMLDLIAAQSKIAPQAAIGIVLFVSHKKDKS